MHHSRTIKLSVFLTMHLSLPPSGIGVFAGLEYSFEKVLKRVLLIFVYLEVNDFTHRLVSYQSLPEQIKAVDLLHTKGILFFLPCLKSLMNTPDCSVWEVWIGLGEIVDLSTLLKCILCLSDLGF